MTLDHLKEGSALTQFADTMLLAKTNELQGNKQSIASIEARLYAEAIQETARFWSEENLVVALDAIAATAFVPGQYLCAFLPCNNYGTPWSEQHLREGRQYQFASVRREGRTIVLAEENWGMLLGNLLQDVSLVEVEAEMTPDEIRSLFAMAFARIAEKFLK